jgi:hypothetical protein
MAKRHCGRMSNDTALDPFRLRQLNLTMPARWVRKKGIYDFSREREPYIGTR